jgi:beta-lactamase regulating signal transducer with metallopeptidase domain
MEMAALVHLSNVLSERAADVAVTALWQGVLVAIALTLCLRMAPRISAAYRFVSWATAFLALVCLSVFSLLPQSSAISNVISAHVAENVARPWFSVDARWSLAIAGLWLAVLLYRAADLAIHSLRLRKLWKDAKPVSLDARLATLLATASAECGRGPVEVCTTSTLQRPSVIGFYKPRILIPDWLLGRLTQGELEQIVLHEAEHLRRRDDWTNLVQKLCLVLFPLNPALLWIERRLCREREMACDDAVIRVTRAPRAYAACLASLAERGLERRVEALSLGAWQRRPELVHRVHSILRGKGGLGPVGARLLLGTLGCGLLAGSVELAHSPQLVAFVPVRSAVDGVKNLNAAKTLTDGPVQTASIGKSMGKQKARLSGIHAVTATSVTLRQPSMPTTLKPQSSPSAVMAKAERPTDKQQNARSEQWVILTEWEQVGTSDNNAGLKRDYDIDTSAGTNADAPATTGARQGNRIAVMQLFFRIVPDGSGLPAKAESKSMSKPAISSSTSQPGIAAIRDGWLVLQL